MTFRVKHKPSEQWIAGRRILRGKSYTLFRYQVACAANFRCELCGKNAPFSPNPNPWSSGQVHHVNGRGMGSFKRDDRRLDDDGNIICQWVCPGCQWNEHNPQPNLPNLTTLAKM